MYERKMVEKWVVKFNPLVIELNRLLREIVAEEGITPEVWVYQDPEKLGKGIQAIEVTINPNPHYSDWTKLHIDYCRRFPKSSAFQKLWYPTAVIFNCKVSMWWHCNVYARFWNSRLRFKLGLKHWSDGDC